MMPHIGKVLAFFAVLFVLASPQGLSAEGLRGGFDDAFGPRFHPDARQAPPNSKQRPRHGFDRASDVRHWNQIAIDASGLDHTPVAMEENRAFFGEQLGPGRASRAMAIVHLAMFDAVNAIEGEYKSYTRVGACSIRHFDEGGDRPGRPRYTCRALSLTGFELRRSACGRSDRDS